MSSKHSNKYIITGADGWLGRNLINGIIKGFKDYGKLTGKYQITALKQFESITAPQNNSVNFVFGDMRNEVVLEKLFDNSEGATLIHLAGIIHPKIFVKDLYNINYVSTVKLIQKAISKKVKKIIIMSSNSPFGYNRTNNDFFTEQSPYNPYMAYGSSKMLMEKQVLELAKHNEDCQINIVRAPWFYGPQQPLRQSQFFSMIKNGNFPIIGNGMNKRSMVYTETLSAGILTIAENDIGSGETFWISDREPYEMRYIVSTVRNVLENDFGIKCNNSSIKLPNFFSDTARFSDLILQKLGLYNQKIHVLGELNLNIICSPSKIQNTLNFNAKVDLPEGMRRSIEWCIKSGINI